MTFHAPPALLLNADYRPLSLSPLSTLSWDDAIQAVLKGTHSVIAEYEDIILHSAGGVEMFAPSVVALNRYQTAVTKAPFTRMNVYLRDRFTCQYCAEKFTASGLTFDHVTPRSRGGLSSWENIVAACHPCNQRKANQTPAEAKMPLLRAPVKPSAHALMQSQELHKVEQYHKTWQDYLYWGSELEP